MPANSTRRKSATPRPPKIPKGFPLWVHPSGRWCKKIKGRFHYFGKIGEVSPEDAEREWDRTKDYLRRGESPPPAEDASEDRLTVKRLFDTFLSDCKRRVATGELQAVTLADYQRTCQRFADIIGKNRAVEGLAPADFAKVRTEVAKTRGLAALGTFITKARVPFSWAIKNELIDRVRYGTQFSKPRADKLLKERNGQAEKFYEPDELLALIESANVQLRAMILLAINCGLGNSDIANLTFDHLDLDGGWLTYPRPKTGQFRRCHLWAETIQAVRAWLAVRKEPKDRELSELVFITKQGNSWRNTAKDNPISKEFAKLLRKEKLARRLRSFYSLRHTHRTVSDGAGDFSASSVIMGHALQGMAGVYVRRDRISDDRLRAVSDHIHSWLFGGSDDGE